MRSIALVVFILILGPAISTADSVYRWTDDSGVVHYSSKPGQPGLKPANLPKIMKADMHATSAKVVSCEKHGGVNCQAGADADGSVVCYDGFKDAAPRFSSSCSSPKLELTEISEPSKSGGFSVFVRNSKTVAAVKPVVSFLLPDGRTFNLDGPSEIRPLGFGEFTFNPRPGVVVSKKPTVASINLGCENCGG